MIRLYIKDLKPGDILLKQNFAVKDIVKKLSKNNTHYYTLTLSDKTGQVDAKIWADYFKDVDLENIKIGSVISVTGKVDSFRDENQVMIEKSILVEDFDPADYVTTSEYDIDEIYAKILDTVNSLEDAEIKKLILELLDLPEIKSKFLKTPAAMMIHHNYVGGLVVHVYEILTLAKASMELYPEANFSELAFGAIFHDIGKLEELDAGSLALNMTKEGKLLGHVVQGLLLLERCIPSSFDKNKKLRLIHMVASHNGKKEIGAPVTPSTIEAFLLSEIDNLSFKIGTFRMHLQKGEIDENGFSTYSPYLGASLVDPKTY